MKRILSALAVAGALLFTTGAANASPLPLSGPNFPWQVGDCADIQLNPVSCADVSAVWQVTHVATTPTASYVYNSEHCAPYGAVSLTLGSVRVAGDHIETGRPVRGGTPPKPAWRLTCWDFAPGIAATR